MGEVYLDHAATTQTREEVVAAMKPFLHQFYGNPSSTHRFGRNARAPLEHAREQVAHILNADIAEITLTSGGTEADNTALLSAVLHVKGKKHIITTAMEHHAVLHTCEFLESFGVEITYLKPDSEGSITVQQVLDAIRPETCLVSIMYVNNETGAIQPIPEIAQAIRRIETARPFFHTDAVQAIGLLDCDVQLLGVDYLALSGHKFAGPKGVGALYARRSAPFTPFIHGGAQERGRRAGTENVAGVVGMGAAAELAAKERVAKYEHLSRVKKHMLDLLQAGIEGLVLNSPTNSVPSILNVAIPGMPAETLLIKLDMLGIAAASGSACTSGSIQPSHVLTSMGFSKDRVKSSVRYSFAATTTIEEVTFAAEKTIQLVNQYKQNS